MKTAQIMERTFKDGVIRQNHKTAWFNATDLLKISNQYRTQIGLSTKAIADYLKTDSTKEFIKEILDRENISVAYDSKKGKNGGTWVHPLLLIDIAMWLSPEFKYDAMKWLQDELIKLRDNGGNSYKKLTSSISQYYGLDVARVGTTIPKVASAIKKNLKVTDWNTATEEQLKKRDEIQKNICMLLSAGVEINKACLHSIREVLKC